MRNKITFLLMLNGVVLFAQNQQIDSIKTIRRSDTIHLIKNPIQSAIFICRYGDSKLMVLSSNGKTYEFKTGIEDGFHIAYYDKELKNDTAMIAVIKKGKVNGLQQRWGEKDHKLWEECEYKNGMRNGYCKWYYYVEGSQMINVDRWENDVHQEAVQME
jgi:hypothetical protein